MKLLEQKIKEDGKVLPGDILKVDSFINHQIDTKFFIELAQEVKRLFPDEKINKILTVEASGIGISMAVASQYDFCKVVFAKKNTAYNMSSDKYSVKLFSYTRRQEFFISVSKEYLSSEDNVLIVDDFLANGEAMNALTSICQQAGCKVAGCVVCVEKAYQQGRKRIENKGYRVEALASIKSMNDIGDIEFC